MSSNPFYSYDPYTGFARDITSSRQIKNPDPEISLDNFGVGKGHVDTTNWPVTSFKPVVYEYENIFLMTAQDHRSHWQPTRAEMRLVRNCLPGDKDLVYPDHASRCFRIFKG